MLNMSQQYRILTDKCKLFEKKELLDLKTQWIPWAEEKNI